MARETKESKADRRIIDVDDAESLRWWADHFDVPPSVLLHAVNDVGPDPQDVARKLQGKGRPFGA
jgi:hypothetical protein